MQQDFRIRIKCEEILGELNSPEDIIVCSFDLNNLRRINDSMGHDAGDAYYLSVCLFVCDLPYHRNILSEDLGETNLSQCCRGLINKR